MSPAIPLTWVREGKQSGPANVLNGRYEVLGTDGRWFVYDRVDPRSTRRLIGYRSAADARRAAELIAQGVDVSPVTGKGLRRARA